MGDRGHVHIADTGVYLYTHWEATELPQTVAQALAREQRWNDPEYLARIIFDEMTEGRHGEETGFGIGTAKHGDVWRVIEVNCERREVSVVDGAYEWSDEEPEVGTFSFEEFAETTERFD